MLFLLASVRPCNQGQEEQLALQDSMARFGHGKSCMGLPWSVEMLYSLAKILYWHE